ncbi:tyrosine-type recombinase/integrase [Sporolituus thermophilus]|uniref:Integrase/recombinase XerD n=1 Tax=Sporolituus thermophilus DSM 23256 TaxID=1123285 RepID=A0A1G7JZQ5_9FIRM|nr:tyrosine-type recombinase/integrase [Sporolituus thermophilus]SDF30370.1 integrase/recombinase XerD [Sporolituus thermophilus DSM 23256]
MTFGEAKKIFLIAKKAQNIAETTYSSYEQVLRFFGQWLYEEKQVIDIEHITSDFIREFFAMLKNQGKRGITLRDYYIVFNVFFNFLYNEEYLHKNPMKNITKPKTEKKQMRTFTAQEIAKMLNCWDKNTFWGYRNYCMFCLLFSTGIRKSEIINLTLADINITNDLIRIAQGKGMKERFVPIGKTMKKVLQHYLKMREEYLQEEECKWLFFSQRQKKKLTPSGLNCLFRRLKQELNLQGEKISCHTWRHTFAKNYLLNGGDIFSLQKILGHSDIATTKNYLNLTDHEMKMQHAKFNPLDNRDWLY